MLEQHGFNCVAFLIYLSVLLQGTFHQKLPRPSNGCFYFEFKQFLRHKVSFFAVQDYSCLIMMIPSSLRTAVFFFVVISQFSLFILNYVTAIYLSVIIISFMET